MIKKKISIIVFVAIFVVGTIFVFTDMNTKYQDINGKYNDLFSEYNKLNTENIQLMQDYERKDRETIQGNHSFIQMYRGIKYPVASGIRVYIGKEPLRIYPNSKAPYVFDDFKPQVVNLINEVGVGPERVENWCLVMDSSGVVGYAYRSDLRPIEENEEYNSYDYGNGIETLGVFKVGDRIEALIGLLDRDYYLIYENGRIYKFPDNKSRGITVEPHQVPSSDIHSLDAFAGYTNHIRRLRTDSSEFPLKDGYKVGDNAMKVFNFYASKYKSLDDPESEYEYPGYTFILEDGHMLEFYIDTEELNENSVITSIWID